jgi:hypothetical protein
MTSFNLESIDQFEAARTGNLAWFQFYKAESRLPNLNLSDEENWLPLELAARSGHLDIIRYLIEDSGQSLEIFANDTDILRIAAAHGHLDIVRYLIDEVNPLMTTCSLINLAFRVAAAYEHLAIVRYLIEDSGHPVDVFVNDTEPFGIITEFLSSELREYLETVIPIINALGLDLAREFFKSSAFDASKNTATVPMKGRI